MARKVHTEIVEVDGEERTVHFVKPSGSLMLRLSDQFKAGKLTNDQSVRDLFVDCLRLNAEGAPMTKKQIDEIVDDDFDFTLKLQGLLSPPQPKKDEEKNA